jgi:fluoride exporter
MSVSLLLAVALAGAAGAAARYSVDRAARAWLDGKASWGIFTVNVTGSFGLGLLFGLTLALDVPHLLTVAIGAGFLGAYTTFSTWMYETVKLMESRQWRAAATNITAPQPLSLLWGEGLG